MFTPSVSSLATTQTASWLRQEVVRREFFWMIPRLRSRWQAKTSHYKYVNVHSKCAVLVNLRMKICGWLFVRTIVTQEFAILSVTIVKIRSYSTKTAIVTDKSGCWSVTMDVYHIAEESRETLTVWQENGWLTGISYHTAEETGETLTVWKIMESSECIASLPDVRAPDCNVLKRRT